MEWPVLDLLEFRDGYVEVDSIHYAISLKLNPHPVRARPRKDDAELYLRTAVGDEWVLMHHVDEVVARSKHVRPHAQVFLESFAWINREADLGPRSGRWLRRNGFERDVKVFGRFRPVVARNLYGSWSLARHENRLRDQLRSGAVRKEVAEHSEHARLGKHDPILKRAVVCLDRVAMLEEFEILADHEGVKELFVNDEKVSHRSVFPGIVNGEGHRCRLPSFRGLRDDRQVQVKGDRIRYSRSQLHPAPRAYSRAVRADVRVHRADVDRILRRVGGRALLRRCRHAERNQNQNDGNGSHIDLLGRLCRLRWNQHQTGILR